MILLDESNDVLVRWLEQVRSDVTPDPVRVSAYINIMARQTGVIVETSISESPSIVDGTPEWEVYVRPWGVYVRPVQVEIPTIVGPRTVDWFEIGHEVETYHPEWGYDQDYVEDGLYQQTYEAARAVVLNIAKHIAASKIDILEGVL